MLKIRFFIYLLFVSFVFSCVPKKEVVYLQEIKNNTGAKTNYEPLIKADDVLFIHVSTLDPKAAEPFNIGQNEGGVAANAMQLQRNTYLVNNEGFIQFPVLGDLKVSGLKRNEVIGLLRKKIAEFVKDPVINLRIMNYKISVTGEVNNPGTYTISSERITIFEALAMAGDMTLFGKRENVLIIRENQGEKITARLDITNPNVINSPYYYLTQNDVVYVEPNKRKINSTAIGPNILAGISILGFALTTIILLTK
ncbi:MAG: polysaccharide biosynthesis/export family protein [Flavobacterium sp.]|uniref:polysaccharide biosynthesis/export family protein n=1 Tax=Flavobacterium sp. TaxID=239 RepID=UPI003BA4296E